MKFIPTNFHYESIQITSSINGENEKFSTHEFNSVGAFTTFHSNKTQHTSEEFLSDYAKIIKENVSNEKPIIQDELVLLFYSLQVFANLLETYLSIRNSNLSDLIVTKVNFLMIQFTTRGVQTLTF